MYDTEDKHIEMRSRIMIDSVVNFNKYTDHSLLNVKCNKCTQ